MNLEVNTNPVIDNVLILIEHCFVETYKDIKRHSENNLKEDYILASDYLRVTNAKIKEELNKLKY